MIGLRCAWRRLLPIERRVLAAWSIALFAIIVRLLLLPPGARTLFPTYHQAGIHWLAGVDLYPTAQTGVAAGLFRYSPTSALLFTPFACNSQKVGDIAWRLLNTIVLASGLMCFVCTVVPESLSRRQKMLFLALMLPFAAIHLSNGQCNALVLGLILIAFGSAAKNRWNLAAICLTLSSFLKIYPIATALLLAVIYPRKLTLRLLGMLGFGAVLPFAFERPEYVARQYQLWLQYALHEDRSTWTLAGANVDFQLLCRVWLQPITLTTYRIIATAAGLLFAGVVVLSRIARRPARRQLTLALGLACVWMTTFGPATESPTYLILTPSIVWSVMSLHIRPAGRLVACLMNASLILLMAPMLVASHARAFEWVRTLGPQPIAGLTFMVGLILQEFQWRPEATLSQMRSTELPHAQAA